MELGVVDTIYEDDEDSHSLSSSPSSPSLPPVLRHAVQQWSLANGSSDKPDVIIRLQQLRFPLHRDPITSQSSYLRRQLSETSEIAVELPAGLTVDAFVHAVASCYGADVALSSAEGLAAAWAAADWLELTAEDGLARRAEDYFFQAVATDCGRAASVLRSCLAFLGGEAASTAASLLVRCLETLAASCSVDGGAWLEEVAALPLDEFQVVVEAMRARFAHDHDLIYTIVDHYLQNHNGKLREDDKSRLCYNVNCSKLSQHLLMHVVQNPRLPLRFVVQAMLLHSHHHHLLSEQAAAAAAASTMPAAGMTLGDILQRDAARRQSAHIRKSMHATGHRIDTLERELAGLRCRLRRSEQTAAKSASFRITRSRLWDGEDLLTSSAAAKGLKSRLLHGFKNLFGRRSSDM